MIDYKCCIDVYLRPPSAAASFKTMPTVLSPAPSVAKTRLPRLELKRFKGDVTCWIMFWDTFKAAVHENKQDR